MKSLREGGPEHGAPGMLRTIRVGIVLPAAGCSTGEALPGTGGGS